mmetsp:Transcript_101734/g.328285  ORF Transcript_101734/g.328285 Transcript_101734/m.328285 type:complete len:110 (+) Transcript_101734:1-330(+)
MQAKTEAVLAELEAALEPAQRHCDELTERADGCAAELQRLRAEVLSRLGGLEEASSRCEDEIRRAAEATLTDWRQRRRARIIAEMRLVMDGLGHGCAGAEGRANQSRRT